MEMYIFNSTSKFCFTKGKEYELLAECDEYYCMEDDIGRRHWINKKYFTKINK